MAQVKDVTRTSYSPSGDDDFAIQVHTGLHYAKNFSLHTHASYEIYFCLKGSGTQYYIDQEFAFTEGDVFICPPHLPHWAVEDDEHAKSGWILFKPELFSFSPVFHKYLAPFTYTDISFNPSIPSGSEAAKEIISLIKKILKLPEDKKLRRIAYLTQILACISEYYNFEYETAAKKPKDEISAALTYIHTNYTENIKISELCRKAGMSVSRFEEHFKKAMFCSPKAYIKKIRIFAAKKSILDGSSITEVSYACGFPDPGSFTKTFKKETGLTPKEWQKKHLIT
jgi:AraC-like DNA-binding protein